MSSLVPAFLLALSTPPGNRRAINRAADPGWADDPDRLVASVHR
ncbi:hypothetical protein [Corynebacterium callunae]|nr:hypothetical protein [Corynebacterium callunae]